MRIESLSGYRYEITEAGEYRKLQAPISGYSDTYLTIFFKVSDNKVFMKVPYIEYSGPDNDSNFAFSLLYDRDYIKAFFENNDYSLNDKLVYGIQYTSVTDCSVVLRITNYTEDSYIFNGEATVYRVDDSGNIIRKVQLSVPQSLSGLTAFHFRLFRFRLLISLKENIQLYLVRMKHQIYMED